MAKIILGKRPESFARTVHFLQVDGTPGSMGVTFRYRTRTEFGTFTDELIAQERAQAAAEMDKLQALIAKGQPLPDLSQSEILAREAKAKVSYVMGCISGWDLDVPFDLAAVEQLADEVPAALPALVNEYRDAIVEGRQGN